MCCVISWEKEPQIWAQTDGDLNLGSGTFYCVTSGKAASVFSPYTS